MLEVKDNCLIIDGAIKPLKSIHMVKSFEHDFYFLNTENGTCRQYPYSIKELYNILQKANLHNFVFIQNTIINLDKVEYIYIEDCSKHSVLVNDWENQYAKYALVFMFKTDRKEEIGFDIFEEAEHYYHEIDTKLTDLKNAEDTCN